MIMEVGNKLSKHILSKLQENIDRPRASQALHTRADGKASLSIRYIQLPSAFEKAIENRRFQLEKSKSVKPLEVSPLFYSEDSKHTEEISYSASYHQNNPSHTYSVDSEVSFSQPLIHKDYFFSFSVIGSLIYSVRLSSRITFSRKHLTSSIDRSYWFISSFFPHKHVSSVLTSNLENLSSGKSHSSYVDYFLHFNRLRSYLSSIYTYLYTYIYINLSFVIDTGLYRLWSILAPLVEIK